MARTALSNGGGEAARFALRLPREELPRLDEVAKQRGFPDRSAFIRALIDQALTEVQEVTSQAS